MPERALPHDPYITAVVDALANAGLDPDSYWTDDAETDPRGDGCEMMLDAVLTWNDDHHALNAAALPHGLILLWAHSAEQWQYAPLREHGANEEPQFLPYLGQYADPAAIVPTVRALLAGEPVPEGYAPYWHPADAVKAAVEAWAAEGGDAR